MYYIIRACFTLSSLAQELVGVIFACQLLDTWFYKDPYASEILEGDSTYFPHPLQSLFLAIVATFNNLIIYMACLRLLLSPSARSRRTYKRASFNHLITANNYLLISDITGWIICWTGASRWEYAFEECIKTIFKCTANRNCTNVHNIVESWLVVTNMSDLFSPCFNFSLLNLKLSENKINGIIESFRQDDTELFACMNSIYGRTHVSALRNYGLNFAQCFGFVLLHLIFLGLLDAATENLNRKHADQLNSPDAQGGRKSELVWFDDRSNILKRYFRDILIGFRARRPNTEITSVTSEEEPGVYILKGNIATWEDRESYPSLESRRSKSEPDLLIHKQSVDSEFLYNLREMHVKSNANFNI